LAHGPVCGWLVVVCKWLVKWPIWLLRRPARRPHGAWEGSDLRRRSGNLGDFGGRRIFLGPVRGSNPARCVTTAKAQRSHCGIHQTTGQFFWYNKQIFTSNLVVKMTWIKQKKKQSQRTVSPDARVRDPMMEVARNGGFRRRITTDAYFSCVLRVCVHHARVHVACAMFLEAVQSRRPRRPRRLSSIPRWPTSHCGFSISL
jgi:hypothetical protein